MTLAMMLSGAGVVTPPPVLFFTDLFGGSAGTNLTAHTPDLGGAWSDPLTNPIILNGDGTIRQGASGFQFFNINAVVPPSANYYVEADIIPLTATSRIGPGGRGIDPNNHVRLVYDFANNLWSLIEMNASTQTLLASVADTIVGTVTARITFSGTTVTGSKNGVDLFGPQTTGVLAAGSVCVFGQPSLANNASGLHLGNMNAAG